MLTLISGFVISVSMLYSFNIKEPHHARGHAYAHSSSTGIAFTLLYMLKACLGFGLGFVRLMARVSSTCSRRA